MPINAYYQGKGAQVMRDMKRRYGAKKGEQVFYATANKKDQKPKDKIIASGEAQDSTGTIRATSPNKSQIGGSYVNKTSNARAGETYRKQQVSGGELHYYKGLAKPVFVKKKQPRVKRASATTTAGASSAATGSYT